MTRELWINLPVKDVKRSKAFFAKLGFSFIDERETNDMIAMKIGEKNVPVMLFAESTFKGFTNKEIADTRQGTEVLLSIDAQSKEEVDEIAAKAIDAGGKSNHKPSEMNGWMYGCVFTDPDGHQWNVLYMDMEKMPKTY